MLQSKVPRITSHIYHLLLRQTIASQFTIRQTALDTRPLPLSLRPVLNAVLMQEAAVQSFLPFRFVFCVTISVHSPSYIRILPDRNRLNYSIMTVGFLHYRLLFWQEMQCHQRISPARHLLPDQQRQSPRAWYWMNVQSRDVFTDVSNSPGCWCTFHPTVLRKESASAWSQGADTDNSSATWWWGSRPGRRNTITENRVQIPSHRPHISSFGQLNGAI